MWDASTGKPITPPMHHESNVLLVAFSADGSEVVTACADHTTREWDATSGRLIGPSLQHKDRVLAASFSSDRLEDRNGQRRPYGVCLGCGDGPAIRSANGASDVGQRSRPQPGRLEISDGEFRSFGMDLGRDDGQATRAPDEASGIRRGGNVQSRQLENCNGEQRPHRPDLGCIHGEAAHTIAAARRGGQRSLVQPYGSKLVTAMRTYCRASGTHPPGTSSPRSWSIREKSSALHSAPMVRGNHRRP